MITKKSKLRLYFRASMLQKSTSINIDNFENNFQNEIVKMAIKALKRPKTELLSCFYRTFGMVVKTRRKFLNQSFEIKAPVTLNDDAFASLSDDERMEYEERAAIMEYDGGLSRAEAEKRAFLIIFERRHQQ